MLLTEAVSQEKWNKGVGGGEEGVKKECLDLFWGAEADSRRLSRSLEQHRVVPECYVGQGRSSVPSCCDPACRLLGKKPTMRHQEATTFSAFEVQLYRLVKVIETYTYKICHYAIYLKASISLKMTYHNNLKLGQYKINLD